MHSNNPASRDTLNLQRLLLVLGTSLFTLLACTTANDQPPTAAPAQPALSKQDSAPTAAQPTYEPEQSVVAPARPQAERRRIAGLAEESYAIGMMPPTAINRWPTESVNRENYGHFETSPIKLTSADPVSTFSIDVDTGSYANVRRMLHDGYLPAQDAVRVEELINYFSYDYEQPQIRDVPFSINMEMTTSPWNPDTHLLRVGLQGYEPATAARPAANLVFLIDVSGSMQDPNKLPLLKNAFRLLTKQLQKNDSVALVVYAGGTGIVLAATPGNEHATIIGALEQLHATGSTNGAAGIRLAYQLAEQGYIANGINRVILATDGDFNLGTVNFEALLDLVENRRASGISLTTLGFGSGNYNDHLMEQLADKGNGNYAYIDNLMEARKVLVEELTATLQTIAQDVKIQIEFNPATVAEYRLIGYENRLLRREDFNNDKIDAGEIGAGHTVTALYEVSLVGSSGQRIDPLRYGNLPADNAMTTVNDEIAFVRLRYKEPGSDHSRLIEQPLQRSEIVSAESTSSEMLFAAAVAAFGQRLRGGDYLNKFDYQDIRQLANRNRGGDEHGYRGEFWAWLALRKALVIRCQAGLPRDKG